MEYPPDIAAPAGYVPWVRLFQWSLKGNAEAVDLCLAVLEWADHYDHLVDGDLPLPAREAALHDAMWKLAVDVPSNSFFKANQNELTVTLANSVLAWRTATRLQRDGDPHGAKLAYVMRWVPLQFFLHCARIVGGVEWAEEISPQFWRITTRDHSFEQFSTECGV